MRESRKRFLRARGLTRGDLGNRCAMDQETTRAHERFDPTDTFDHDVADMQQAQAVKVQGELLLEESRSLTLSSRALLEDIDPSAI